MHGLYLLTKIVSDQQHVAVKGYFFAFGPLRASSTNIYLIRASFDSGLTFAQFCFKGFQAKQLFQLQQGSYISRLNEKRF